MAEYIPDRWKLIKITNSTGKVHFRIFATWGGSYLYGSSWKISSGCAQGATLVDGSDDWNLPQSSGSNYHIRSSSEGVCGGWGGVITTYADQMETVGGKLEVIDNPDFSKLKSEFI
jgi:hypothetical protein